jgi:hypothetical protein
MSEAMNSSCFNPVLPSHSGVEPASGATRSGGEAVDDNLVLNEEEVGTGLKASPLDTIKAATAIENFILLLVCSNDESVDEVNVVNGKAFSQLTTTRKKMRMMTQAER